MCGQDDEVAASGFQEARGARRRSFRCHRCARRFTPGAAPKRASPEIRAAVRRVRREADVPYRLLARALSQQLGIEASHATVGAWCRAEDPGSEADRAPCEYISLLWAIREEIRRELSDP